MEETLVDNMLNQSPSQALEQAMEGEHHTNVETTENEKSPNSYNSDNSNVGGVKPNRYNHPNKSTDKITDRPIHTIPLPGGDDWPNSPERAQVNTIYTLRNGWFD